MLRPRPCRGARRQIARFIKAREEGSVAVEFAVGAICLYTAVLGIIELGRFGFVQQSLERAVRLAGREAIVRSVDSPSPIDASGVESLVRSHALSGNGAALQVTATYPSGNQTGEVVIINASYPFTSIFFILPSSTINIEAHFTGSIVF